mmetsp:Transcript_5703/g.23093  ORF Transcript_5703/g.23093 Transcript_5703/m.23093 type:complete len:242 (-) Transcript_5703:632-1357(-)
MKTRTARTCDLLFVVPIPSRENSSLRKNVSSVHETCLSAPEAVIRFFSRSRLYFRARLVLPRLRSQRVHHRVHPPERQRRGPARARRLGEQVLHQVRVRRHRAAAARVGWRRRAPPRGELARVRAARHNREGLTAFEREVHDRVRGLVGVHTEYHRALGERALERRERQVRVHRLGDESLVQKRVVVVASSRQSLFFFRTHHFFARRFRGRFKHLAPPRLEQRALAHGIAARAVPSAPKRR